MLIIAEASLRFLGDSSACLDSYLASKSGLFLHILISSTNFLHCPKCLAWFLHQLDLEESEAKSRIVLPLGTFPGSPPHQPEEESGGILIWASPLADS